MRRKPSLHRDIYHMTRLWARLRSHTPDEVTVATRRLMSRGPTAENVQQWLADLRTVVAGVEERAKGPRDTQSVRLLYAHQAALRVRARLNTMAPEAVVAVHQSEEGKWVKVG